MSWPCPFLLFFLFLCSCSGWWSMLRCLSWSSWSWSLSSWPCYSNKSLFLNPHPASQYLIIYKYSHSLGTGKFWLTLPCFLIPLIWLWRLLFWSFRIHTMSFQNFLEDRKELCCHDLLETSLATISLGISATLCVDASSISGCQPSQSVNILMKL